MVLISFTREELAEMIKVADDRQDYAERAGLVRMTEERWLAVRREAAAKLDPGFAVIAAGNFRRSPCPASTGSRASRRPHGATQG
jgi:hypothetical protein